MADYVHPNCTATVLYEGGRVQLNQSQTWHSNDPFVKARPDLFSTDPIEVAHSTGFDPHEGRGVERGTRAPGEKRLAPSRPRLGSSSR